MTPLKLGFPAAIQWVLSGSLLLACAPAGSGPEGPAGNVQVGLIAQTAEHTYRLRDATFDITTPLGAPVAALDSESDPDGTELTQRLDPGDYQIQLLDDWFMTRIDPGEPEVIVDAELQSPAEGSASFSIADGITTTVPYTFTTNGVPIGFGTGKVAVSIVVSEVLPTTQLDLALDPPTITTELGTTSTVELTLSASAGFAGPVGLAGTLRDADGEPLTGWNLAIEPATVVVPLDGVATATATITIPSENEGLSGVARFVATSAAGLGVDTGSVAITALNQYTIGMTLNGVGLCVYPPAGTLRLTSGTKLRWFNGSSEDISIHTDGIPGCPHQAGSSQPGTAYECNVGAALGTGAWYCHAPGPNVSGLNVQVVAP